MHESIDVRLQLQLKDQIQSLHKIEGKAEKYLATAKNLWDRMITSQLPLHPIHYFAYLIRGFPDKWESFKTNMRLQVHTYNEGYLCNLILQEDRDLIYRRDQPQSVMTNKTTCETCGKEGHERLRCYLEPLYYCPRCMANGHKPTEYPKRNNKNKNNKNRKDKKDKDNMETSMIMDTISVMEHCGKALTCGNFDNNVHPSKMHEWIVDSGSSKQMTPDGIQLSNFKTLAKPIPVMTGFKQIIYAICMGDVNVTTNENMPLELHNVFHVPKLVYPLI